MGTDENFAVVNVSHDNDLNYSGRSAAKMMNTAIKSEKITEQSDLITAK